VKSILLLILVAFPGLLSADTIQVGAPLPALALTDQEDKPRSLSADTRLLIFAAERDTSRLVDAVLDGQTAATLDAAGIRYVADISAMPAMVTSLIALPKMRARPYPVLLGHKAEDTAVLPREPGKVTLIEADGGTIAAVRFIADAETLGAALRLRP
jgi:hypothetical protein